MNKKSKVALMKHRRTAKKLKDERKALREHK